MESNAVVDSFRALMQSDEEAAQSFLYAAVYAHSLHSGVTPRGVVETLFKAMPSDDAWPAMRNALASVLED